MQALSAAASPSGASVAGERDRIRIGVSACLLGEPVRFDGGHKRSHFVTDELAPFVEFVRVCPEVESGMSTPRPAVRLVRGDEGARMLEVKSGLDHTERMETYAELRVQALLAEDLSGFILKKDSPSCGMTRVKTHGRTGMPIRDGVGLFAGALMRSQPDLPVEEEGRLHDAALRENFIERVFAYVRLRSHFARDWTSGEMIAFHTAQKLHLMAHSPKAYQSLGRLVAEHHQMDRDEFERSYVGEFMAALKVLATRGRQTNVLQHAAGYLKKQLDAASRAELAELIEDYRQGLVPLSVPVALVRHHVRVHEIDYLQGQVHLDPHPKELMLRNHV